MSDDDSNLPLSHLTRHSNSLHELCLSGKEGAPDLRDLQHVYVDSDSIDPADLGMSDLGGSILELPLTFSVTEALLHADPTSLDELDLRGMTALSWACRIGQVDQVRNLLVHGANANGNVHGSRFTAPAYQSVFYQAYYASTCREILTLLFDHGAALGSQYKDGTNVDIFHTLLELAIEHDMMDFTDDTEWIHNIALKHGANINAVDSHGDHLLSRLRTAARFHRRYMDWVLKSGCSTDYDRIGFRKSLASAMVYRNNEFIKYLVERSVNIQDAADRYGETALHKAAQWTVGDLNTLILARDLSVEVDVHAFNNDGYTAYDIAKCQSTCPFEEIRESDTCSRSDYHCFAGLPYGKGQQAYGQAWFKVFCDFQDEWEAQYNLATKRRMLEGELLDAPLNIPGAFPD